MLKITRHQSSSFEHSIFGFNLDDTLELHEVNQLQCDTQVDVAELCEEIGSQ